MFWIIFIPIWIIGWLSAYPRNKKWLIENKITTWPDEWVRIDTIKALAGCFIAWGFVWADVFYKKVEEFIDDCEWLQTKSKY